MANTYYNKVKEYYNEDSLNFEDRYWENPTLQRIRESFREETTPYVKGKVLEIGYGPGLDIGYFASTYPNSKICGIDISDGMYSWASKQMEQQGLENTKLAVGSVEDVSTAFKDQKFDLIYVYFGALNTVEDIYQVQHHLADLLNPQGTMVLTFVNKWYALAILKPLLKLKVKTARLRLNKVWGGYSPSKFLASKCYSYREIRKAFDEFRMVYKRGYSILYPAWYENSITQRFPKLTNLLWHVDRFLQKTPLWNLGEYSLYVFKQKN